MNTPNTRSPIGVGETNRVPSAKDPVGSLISLAWGVLFGLALLKFGNPIVLDKMIDPPADIWQWLFSPWPVRWGQVMLALLAIGGLFAARFQLPSRSRLLVLPALWFGWQLVSATGTMDPALTRITLIHFATCLAAFCVGLLLLGPRGNLPVFAVGVLPFFIWVIWMGFDQHYGGLDATEKVIKETPNWQQIYPPEYLQRIAKKRIFATLVYPNALAGAILLWLPVLSCCVWQMGGRLTAASRVTLIGALVYGGGACLIWSGSKSGWLIALGQTLVAACRTSLPRRLKMAVVTGACLAGLLGFGWKFAPYFKSGATSVGARLQYWRAAWITSLEHPVIGTGPGTFSRAYAKIRPPGAEMAQLVHNDYLEQASDSGFLGMIFYGGFWFCSIALLYRRVASDGLHTGFWIWLGLFGWVVQSISEFGLFIPALAWPAFALVGWLWSGKGHRQEFEPPLASPNPG